jgi:hypothetical protein
LGASVSSLNKLRNSVIGTYGATNSTTDCVTVDQAIEFAIRNNDFSRCRNGIVGQQILGLSVVGEISGNQFVETMGGGSPINGCGESWSVVGNVFENRHDGTASSFGVSPTVRCKALTIARNWSGDVAVAGGVQYFITAEGLNMSGNRIAGAGTSGADVAVYLTGTSAASITANSFAFTQYGVYCDATSSPGFVKALRINANAFNDTPYPFIQSGTCKNLDLTTNDPDISKITFTPTFTGGSGASISGAGSYYVQRGTMVDYQLVATVTSAGTGGIVLGVSGLPFAFDGRCPLSGFQDFNSVAVAGYGSASTTSALLFRYDGAFPAVNGSRIDVRGSCQVLQ